MSSSRSHVNQRSEGTNGEAMSTTIWNQSEKLKMNKTYKPPVLTSIFRILGILTLMLGGLGGLVLCTESTTQGGELIILSFIGGALYFGMAQGIDYLAHRVFDRPHVFISGSWHHRSPACY